MGIDCSTRESFLTSSVAFCAVSAFEGSIPASLIARLIPISIASKASRAVNFPSPSEPPNSSAAQENSSFLSILLTGLFSLIELMICDLTLFASLVCGISASSSGDCAFVLLAVLVDVGVVCSVSLWLMAGGVSPRLFGKDLPGSSGSICFFTNSKISEAIPSAFFASTPAFNNSL